ncbi:hypothetical protein CYMTET_15514 [Cymbomonas tetramitiformis]|uniref:Core-binding (CB) domain-containing protein n=1 Tax=Cymbomonas tetramitiformis TaxID=36881 RepID=A0AAE0GE64_9CHLO|nr:hypothetical protein CYMTET_15514 [Cymbomonas tetramitiformis]
MNSVQGVYSMLCNRWTMLELRAQLEADPSSSQRGGAEALRAKLQFVEDRVYSASDRLVADEVLQQWLDDFDKSQGRAMLSTTSKLAANAETGNARWKPRDKSFKHKDDKHEDTLGKGGKAMGETAEGSLARIGRQCGSDAVDHGRLQVKVGGGASTGVRSRSFTSGRDSTTTTVAEGGEGPTTGKRSVVESEEEISRFSRFSGLCQLVYLAVPAARLCLRELYFVLAEKRMGIEGEDFTGGEVRPRVVVETTGDEQVERTQDLEASDESEAAHGLFNDSLGSVLVQGIGGAGDGGLPVSYFAARLKSSSVTSTTPKVTVGTRLEVFWVDDDKFYPGSVKSFHEDGTAHVVYDDGDEETLNLSEEKFNILHSAGVYEQNGETAEVLNENMERGGDDKENKRGGDAQNFFTRSLCGRWRGELGQSDFTDLAIQMQRRSLLESTPSNYGPKAECFVQFCQHQQRQWLPASEAIVLLYLASLLEAGNIKSSSLQPYLSAINNYHDDLGLTGPAKGRAVTRAVKGMAKIQAEAAVMEETIETQRTWLPAKHVRRPWSERKVGEFDKFAQVEAWACADLVHETAKLRSQLTLLKGIHPFGKLPMKALEANAFPAMVYALPELAEEECELDELPAGKEATQEHWRAFVHMLQARVSEFQMFVKSKTKKCKVMDEWERGFFRIMCEAPLEAREDLVDFLAWAKTIAADFTFYYFSEFYEHLIWQVQRSTVGISLEGYDRVWRIYQQQHRLQPGAKRKKSDYKWQREGPQA